MLQCARWRSAGNCGKWQSCWWVIWWQRERKELILQGNTEGISQPSAGIFSLPRVCVQGEVLVFIFVGTWTGVGLEYKSWNLCSRVAGRWWRCLWNTELLLPSILAVIKCMFRNSLCECHGPQCFSNATGQAALQCPGSPIASSCHHWKKLQQSMEKESSARGFHVCSANIMHREQLGYPHSRWPLGAIYQANHCPRWGAGEVKIISCFKENDGFLHKCKRSFWHHAGARGSDHRCNLQTSHWNSGADHSNSLPMSLFRPQADSRYLVLSRTACISLLSFCCISLVLEGKGGVCYCALLAQGLQRSGQINLMFYWTSKE